MKILEAALDQPNPTPELVRAVNDWLARLNHPARLRGTPTMRRQSGELERREGKLYYKGGG